eukprot:4970894-Pyramimonas_sp.AAC.1
MSRELGHVLIGKEKMEALLKQYSVVMDWRMDGSVPMSFHHYHFFGTHNADDYYQEGVRRGSVSYTHLRAHETGAYL